MNWFMFAIAAWITLGMETGLRDALRIGHSVSPSFVLPLAVFIALSAERKQTLWACFVLGLLVDLTTAVELSSQSASAEALTIIGPYALGFLLAGKFVLTTRSIVIRRNPITLVCLTFASALLVHIVVTSMLSIRASFIDQILFHGGTELLARLGQAVYTAVMALVIAIAAPILTPLLGFHPPSRQGRRI